MLRTAVGAVIFAGGPAVVLKRCACPQGPAPIEFRARTRTKYEVSDFKSVISALKPTNVTSLLGVNTSAHTAPFVSEVCTLYPEMARPCAEPKGHEITRQCKQE